PSRASISRHSDRLRCRPSPARAGRGNPPGPWSSAAAASAPCWSRGRACWSWPNRWGRASPPSVAPGPAATARPGSSLVPSATALHPPLHPIQAAACPVSAGRPRILFWTHDMREFFQKHGLPFLLIVAAFALAALLGDVLLHELGLAWIGRYLGIPGVLLIALSLVYSLRKRGRSAKGVTPALLRWHEWAAWLGSLLV